MNYKKKREVGEEKLGYWRFCSFNAYEHSAYLCSGSEGLCLWFEDSECRAARVRRVAKRSWSLGKFEPKSAVPKGFLNQAPALKPGQKSYQKLSNYWLPSVCV